MNVGIYLDRINSISDKFNIEKIKSAYLFAEKAHKGQFRQSGDEYITHPAEVSLILANLKLDDETIMAGLLHDVLEDTKYSFEDLEENFGLEVAIIVEGVTNIQKIQYESKEVQQSENFRKMLLAMSKDIRVILVKLSDRLHNMRTLNYKNSNSIILKAKETLDIYVPIAHRLGIFSMKWEMEDLAFSYLERDKYEDLVEKMKKQRTDREKYIEDIIRQLNIIVKPVSKHLTIYGRPKNYYSIYKKMQNKNLSFQEIHDITAIRIIVDEISQCYSVLGLIHSRWKPIPGRFKDYIAMPKLNMYQSLHTTLLGEDGDTFEVQIRTHEMHEVAEYGIAAHWKYKEGSSGKGENMNWLEQMVEYQKELDNPAEFISTVKMDLYSSHVYVFTPRGNVIELPYGATPVDFAYKIHTDVGNRCVGAKVNSKIVPLNYELKIGEIVEILTSKNGTPSRDWLNFAKSTQAKNKIRSFFKKESKLENIEKGRDILEKALEKYSLTIKTAINKSVQEKIFDKLSSKSMDHIYSAIGYGGINIKQIMPIIKDEFIEEDSISKIIKPKKQSLNQTGIVVEGMDDMLIKFAKCCNPIPGDDIIGFITRGSGITVHRSNCTNFSKNEKEARFLNVEWAKVQNYNHIANLKIIARDRKNLLNDITTLIQNDDLTLRSVSAKVNNDNITKIGISFSVENVKQVKHIIAKIKGIQSVMEVIRY